MLHKTIDLVRPHMNIRNLHTTKFVGLLVNININLLIYYFQLPKPKCYVKTDTVTFNTIY